MNARFTRKLIKPMRLMSLLAVLSVILAACSPAAPLKNNPAVIQPVTGPTGPSSSTPMAVPTQASTPTGAPSTGAASATPTTAANASPASTTPAATPTHITEQTIEVAQVANLGNILTANNGMTLYVYTLDTQDTSNCSVICQKVWMPLLTLGKPNLGSGVNASMIGTAKLANGNLIVTYNHMPLYFFVGDIQSGQANGQGFDNVWFAVTADGKTAGSVTEISLDVENNPILGNYLVGQGGQAIYTYTNDKPDTSTCTGACLTNWPPVITLGKPKLGTGVNASMIGTIKLPDGSLMLTYNHKPLYYFVADAKSTDAKGQGIKNVWYVLGPDGNQINYLMPKPPASEPVISLGNDPKYGQILTDGNGMTLYIYVNDSNADTTCLGKCLQNWTPLYTLGNRGVASGVNQSMIGTMVTSYGYMIVTYNYLPLYLYKGDKKPGDVNGYGVNNAWYVMGANGNPIVPK